VVFRSLAIPVKAAVFDIVTILATYGVLVAFLTFGWGRSWVGIPHDLPVLSLLAPVFFAVLFGLSNDYEVYLVSRMHEEREAGATPADAVRRGLGGGGRVVVAAALIMVFVFVSYVFQPGAAIKQFGFGMAAAIVLDAFITRMIALPAAMRLGGDAMWWPGRRPRAEPAARPTATPQPGAAGGEEAHDGASRAAGGEGGDRSGRRPRRLRDHRRPRPGDDLPVALPPRAAGPARLPGRRRGRRGLE